MCLVKGAYCLVFFLPEATTLKTRGREFTLALGTYAYCGSALSSLDARLGRHLRSYRQEGVRRFWHIDYLLPLARGLRMIWVATESREECRLVSALAGMGFAPVLGFGNSDCKSGCPGHLLISGDTVDYIIKQVNSAFLQLDLNPKVLEADSA